MFLTIIILSFLLLILLWRHLFIYKEMNRVTSELKRIRLTRTDEYVHMTLADHTLEQLVVEINHLIEDKQDVMGTAVRNERELTNMITSMSHDLRTPLTAMIGYIQLLKQDNLNSQDRAHYLTIVHRRAQQLHALIQSFFALSAMQNDEEPLHLASVDITQIVQACALTYYDAFVENEQTVELKIPEMPQHVIGDVTACERIVENIILNALQHAGKQVDILLESDENTLSFTVKNTMQPEELLDADRLFDRLYTGDLTRKNHRGLGLPIVNRLMKQMGGHVHAQIKGDLFIITCTWKV